MTVKGLHERLEIMMKANSRCKDYVVGIADENFRGMGGTPIFPLKSICNGHDWNNGKTFMQFEKERKP